MGCADVCMYDYVTIGCADGRRAAARTVVGEPNWALKDRLRVAFWAAVAHASQEHKRHHIGRRLGTGLAPSHRGGRQPSATVLHR